MKEKKERERCEREEERMRRLQKEKCLKEQLIKNVYELEQRKKEVQRQLLTLNKDQKTNSLHLKSTVVVPSDCQ